MYRYSKARMRIKKVFLTIFFIVLIGVLSIAVFEVYMTNTKIQDAKSVSTEKENQEVLGVSVVNNLNDTEVVEKAINAVVGISKIKSNGTAIFKKNSITELGLGTGVIIGEEGYILSNSHVTGEKSSTCYVTLENGEVYTGTVVWADSDLDVSIVKITAGGLSSISLGDSDGIKIAETVYAIGNPIGIEFQRTVTKGIVSGKNRSIKVDDTTYMEDLIQTDATINLGNSGGPLINTKGEMVGLNTVKITSAEGIGFALPINIIKPVIEKVIEDGKFEEAYLGIFAYDKEALLYIDDDIELDRGRTLCC